MPNAIREKDKPRYIGASNQRLENKIRYINFSIIS